jgi:hypothetical protein
MDNKNEVGWLWVKKIFKKKNKGQRNGGLKVGASLFLES